jgi:hypothetical protein
LLLKEVSQYIKSGEKTMTTNHMTVSMWTVLDDSQSEKLNGGGSDKYIKASKIRRAVVVQVYGDNFSVDNSGITIS